MSDLHNRLEFATYLAHKAGDIMLRHFQIGVKKDDKSDGTPITIADSAINTLVIEAVKESYPDEGVRGEEASNHKEGAEYVWVCDPIDGTIPYTFGLPVSNFSLALVKNGKPVLGVVYDPYMKRLYHAVTGEGAFVNDQRIHVSTARTLAEGKYIAFANQKLPFYDAGNLSNEIIKRGLWQCSFWCYTTEAMLVATGQLISSLSGYAAAHDIAAVKVIVEEAGGKVTDLFGNEQRYDQPIKGAFISNGLTHDELVEMVKPHLTI
jgi:myo-inositol-1(or 4)-monophosphatase